MVGRVGPKSVLDIVTSVVLIAAAATVLYRSVFSTPPPPEPDIPSEPLSLAGEIVRGSSDASVVLIMYADFQCPFCGRFARDVLPEIDRRYVSTGQVTLSFRHLPLRIHTQAAQAAVVAECAGEQGRFWEMHDLLFAQERLDDEILMLLPESVDIDREAFDRCLLEESIEERIQASAEEAAELGIHATPTFFIGTRLADGRIRVARAVSGARPVADFIEQLDATLHGELPTGWRSWMPFAG